MKSSIEHRLDRVESELAIRHLVASYPPLLDVRDIDSLVELYVSDVAVGRRSGREALRTSFRRVLGPDSPFRATIHFTGSHRVVMDEHDPDAATGVAYCRAEHEFEDKWVVAMLQYWDTYRREADRWLFVQRQMKAFYVSDVLERPNGDGRVKHQLAPGGLLAEADLPEGAAVWREFWASFGQDTAASEQRP